jgi:hypothetical protein
MNTPTARRRNARQGAAGAGVAVTLSLATALGLLIAAGGPEVGHEPSSGSCAPRANAAFAAR